MVKFDPTNELTEEQLEEALVSFIKEQVFGNKVSWQQFLKV